MTTEPRGWPHGLKEWTVAVAGAVFAVLLAHHPMVLSGFARTQNDLGDTRYVHYMLEHGFRWLFRWKGHLDLWSPAFFYPAENVAAYSEVLLGAGPAYWPWRVLGVAPDTALQLWILTVTLLNFAAAFALLRRGFRTSVLAASVGGALFACAAIRVNQTMHFQLFPQGWSLLCVLALMRLSSDTLSLRQRRAWVWTFVLSGVGQLWSGFYLGWFLAFGLFVAFLWALALPETRRGLPRLFLATPFTWLVATLTGVALLVPMATHFLAASREVGLRSFNEVLGMVPRPWSWLHLGYASWFYGWAATGIKVFRLIPMEHEQRIGFGLLTTALATAGLWRMRARPSVRVVALTGLTVVLLATWYGDFVPWRAVYEAFPGAKAIRGVSRVGLLVLVPISIGAALFVQQLAQASRRGAWALAALLGALTLVEQGQTTPAFDKLQNREDLAAIAARIEPSCGAFVFSPVQGYGPAWKYQLDAMWAQLETGVPTLNGYSGNSPPGWLIGDTNLHSMRDEQRVSWAVQQWAHAKGLDLNRVCWAKVGFNEGPDRAQFVEQRVPASVEVGGRVPVEVVMKNTGETTWRPGAVFLGSQAPADNAAWGTARVPLPQPVAPGETARIQFELQAPAVPGARPFQWRLVREGVRWFGPLTDGVDVSVTPPPA